MKYILLSLFLFLTGCLTLGDLFGSNQIHKLNPAIYYRNDICFDYLVTPDVAKLVKEKGSFNDARWGSSFGSYTYRKGKLQFCGVGVLPYQPHYELKVRAPGSLDFFAIKTCHEEDTTENPDRGIFKRNGHFEIRYKPTLEKGLACPLYVSSYSKDQRHGWGVLAFEHPRFQLEAMIQCNGYRTVANGVSICQSRQGLLQEITFKEPVKTTDPVDGAADRKEPCPPLERASGRRFRFKLPARECVYGFIGLESKKVHKMYTIGYENIIVRSK